MTKLSCIKVLFCWCVFAITGFAQGTTQNAEIPRSGQTTPTEQLNRRAINPSSNTIFTKRGALPFKKKISREQKKLLQPDTADLTRYMAFLQKPNTGLIKLFPDIGCEDNANIVRADVDCLKSVPMSAFYSFREKEYTTDYLSDIRLKDDVLITDGLLTQGVFVALGDIALENVALSSEGLSFLNDYKPAAQSGEAAKQIAQLAKGVKSNGYLYRKGLPAEENTTYALRVIAYRGSIFQITRGVFYNMLAGDERADITVAFRVLKKDEAGNITLLWKELTRQDAPKVIFPKKAKRQNKFYQ